MGGCGAVDQPILITLVILAATVTLLVLDLWRIDVVAILCLLALSWTGILTTQESLSGFSSSAVVAIIGVMIMGKGITKTGLMDRFSRAVVRKAGASRRAMLTLFCLTVGLMSGFVQNVGAVALFLPAILDISRREKIPAASMIMPVGFSAILGGTLTMVGSGPLILLNDLLKGGGLAPYGLFSVTPVGLLLLLTGICYFLLRGGKPVSAAISSLNSRTEQEKLIEALRLPHRILFFRVPDGSPLVDKTPEEAGVWSEFHVNVVAISRDAVTVYAPWRETRFQTGQTLALLGGEENIDRFVHAFGLRSAPRARGFEEFGDPSVSGFAEVIVPPRSAMAGQSIRNYSLRKRFAVEPVMVFSKGESLRDDLSDHVVEAGDTIIVYGLWEKIGDMTKAQDFVVATPVKAERKDRSKSLGAGACFLLAIALAFAGAPIPIAFLTGAFAMILIKVLGIQDAYEAVDWKVVFLLAGLIPLGVAMRKTGAAAFLAEQAMLPVRGAHPIFVVLAVALLSTVFSLLLSNVGAIAILAPLVMSIASISGLDPRPLTLMAAICTANSFILPTHQVNAMLMSVGGYKNRDYFRAGGGLTLTFLAVAVPVFHFFYL